jgi:L-ascorbate metabolism protein UlaG (beta-lactamase superfamily)
MSTRIRFFGVAAYELTTKAGLHILIDPFLDENPGSPVKSAELARVDLILVSHAAPDHSATPKQSPDEPGRRSFAGAK